MQQLFLPPLIRELIEPTTPWHRDHVLLSPELRLQSVFEHVTSHCFHLGRCSGKAVLAIQVLQPSRYIQSGTLMEVPLTFKHLDH